MQERLDANSGESTNKAGCKDDDALGDLIRAFRAKLTTRLVVAVCGLVLFGGGVWLLIAMGPLGPGPWVLPFSIVVFGLAYFMGKSSYLICTGAVVQVRFGYRKHCRWDELSEIIDVQIKQGVVSSRRCDLVKKNGRRIELTNLGIDDFTGMIDLIRQQAQSRGIPWKEEHQAVK
jgi:hypothetical protein